MPATLTTADKRLISVDAVAAETLARAGHALTLKQLSFMAKSSMEWYRVGLLFSSTSALVILWFAMTIYTLMPIEELADVECRSVVWIECAVRAGYCFSDGALTSPNHLRDWLRANPDFRAKHYRVGGKHNPRNLEGRFVYFIEAAGLNLIKIGMATDGGRERIRKMQTGSPVELILLAEVAGDSLSEARLHKQFAHLRTQGEWFRAEADLRAFVLSLIAPSRAAMKAYQALIQIPPAL